MLTELPLVYEILTSSNILVKLGLGFTFGLCLGLTGVGGGVLLIPLLQFVLGMHTVLAVGTASIIASLVKVSAAATHVKQRNVEWRQVSLMFMGALPLTLLSTQLIVALNKVPAYQVALNQFVQALIVLVMIASLVLVIRKYKAQDNNVASAEAVAPRKRTSLLSGMFCGSLLGSTGVGGGVILLPLLNSVIGINIKRAVGSSVVLSLMLSAITAWSYTNNGQGDLTTALILVTGAVASIPLTSYLMKRISDKSVYRITIGVIALSLIITIATEVL
ncbi:sulfite exporter TauE/SafE family protein [Vibrio alfacsensis]|uniref:Probable membrane transporter protein n=1 Tax=Vibrio alfacsensis TaxID=1074311 RepID=A0ABM6YW58_9VIBR|nr:sulfite exporter TauE/SafE family protein [Vibrio alfacsensis]AXY01974.1 sulfite exporter TauE/SafE family protein [Vibrio alfacsensis]